MRVIKCIFFTTKDDRGVISVLLRAGKKTNITEDFLAVCSDHRGKLVDHQRYNQPLETHIQFRAALPQFSVCSLILLLAEPLLGGVTGLNRHVDRTINKIFFPLCQQR